MTELARTPPALQRLFQTVDLAPLPQHRTIAQSLAGWRQAREHSLMPGRTQVGREQSGETLASSLIAEPAKDGRDFLLCSVGEAIREASGLEPDSRYLSEMDEARIAARLRRLFRLTLDQGEAVVVHFTEGQRDYEVLAAPVSLDHRRRAVWCTLFSQDLRLAGGN